MMRAKFAEMGSEPLGGSPSEFGQLIAEETEKWGKSGEVHGPQAGVTPGVAPFHTCGSANGAMTANGTNAKSSDVRFVAALEA
jgi:hypothetical protein